MYVSIYEKKLNYGDLQQKLFLFRIFVFNFQLIFVINT